MKTRILIVESEESVRSLLKSRLEQDGYSVLTAATADEALSKLSEISTENNGRNLVSLSEVRLQKVEGVQGDSISSASHSGFSKGTPHLQLVSGSGLPAEVFSSGLSYTELKKNWSDSFEKEYLLATLNRHGGNVSAAARQAKLDRSNFLRLLRRHGLHASEFRKDLKDAKETPDTKKTVAAA